MRSGVNVGERIGVEEGKGWRWGGIGRIEERRS